MKGTFAALRARGIYFVSKMIQKHFGLCVLFPECNGLQGIVSIAQECMDITYIICKPVILKSIDIFSRHCNSDQLSA
jgi:hypothetical protein